jgi:glycosyltransferase involved in cell wall biosynthesis
MNNIISIITPVHAPSIEYLASAYASIVDQDMPEGWSWEWIVQEDGRTGDVEAALPDDERISAGHGRTGGPGTARMFAMARARGSLVKALDADDQLMAGVLSRDINVMTQHAEIGWTTSRTLDLLPDGSTVGFDDDEPAPGVLPVSYVYEHWKSHDYRLLVHPASLCIRHDLLFALGGWMALPASEDTGLLIAASVTSPGYFIGDPGLLYRKWSGQVTHHEDHTDHTEWTARMQVIEARAKALRSMAEHNK